MQRQMTGRGGSGKIPRRGKRLSSAPGQLLPLPLPLPPASLPAALNPFFFGVVFPFFRCLWICPPHPHPHPPAHEGERGDRLAVPPVRDGAPERHQRQSVPLHASLVGDSAAGSCPCSWRGRLTHLRVWTDEAHETARKHATCPSLCVRSAWAVGSWILVLVCRGQWKAFASWQRQIERRKARLLRLVERTKEKERRREEHHGGQGAAQAWRSLRDGVDHVGRSLFFSFFLPSPSCGVRPRPFPPLQRSLQSAHAPAACRRPLTPAPPTPVTYR